MPETLSAEDLAGAADAPTDEDLAFLRPGYHRPAPAAPTGPEQLSAEDLAGATEVAAPAPEDRIGRAAREFNQNTAALSSMRQATPSNPAPSQGAADVSKAESFGRGALQGASLGWGDEVAAAADTLISKVPGVRSVAEHFAPAAGGRGGSLDYTDPNITYEQRRNAYRQVNADAQAANPISYGGGELAGGLATMKYPGLGSIKGATAFKVGLQGAAAGGIMGAGSSNAQDVGDIAHDTEEGAKAGFIGGAVLHAAGSKIGSLLANKLPQLADRQAVAQLTRDVPQSLTEPVTRDANLSSAINEPIPVANGKSVTLRDVAGKSAEDVRPIVQMQKDRVSQKIGGLLDTAGDAKLSDLAKHYDTQAGLLSRSPGNEKAINALQGARDEALERWGPTDDARQAKLNEIVTKTDELYGNSDKKDGGATLGDLIKRYNDEIGEISKQPGNEAYVASLEHARDSAAKAWGMKQVLDPEVMVHSDILDQLTPGKPQAIKAGEAVSKLEDLAKSHPAQAADFNAEAQRIRGAASTEGFDPTAKIPAKDVRAYATKLQNEAETTSADPKIAARARQYIGTVTKDFINDHVENSLGQSDRKALESLNQRTSNLLRWPDVVSGKEADPAVRDAVLGEFGGQKVPARDLDAYASKLEDRGTQRIDKLSPGEASLAKENLGKSTRAFVDQHAARKLNLGDMADFKHQTDLRGSLNNIDNMLQRREGKEVASKMGAAALIAHGASGLLGYHEAMNVVPKVLAGDIPGAAMDAGKAIGAVALPFVAKNAGAIGRAAVRAGADATTGLLPRVIRAAEAGNPWAKRQLATLALSSPQAVSRIAAIRAAMHETNDSLATASPPPPQ